MAQGVTHPSELQCRRPRRDRAVNHTRAIARLPELGDPGAVGYLSVYQIKRGTPCRG